MKSNLNKISCDPLDISAATTIAFAGRMICEKIAMKAMNSLALIPAALLPLFKII